MHACNAHDLAKGELMPVGEQVFDHRIAWLPSRVGHWQIPPLTVSWKTSRVKLCIGA
jgi:hypothetical protein